MVKPPVLLTAVLVAIAALASPVAAVSPENLASSTETTETALATEAESGDLVAGKIPLPGYPNGYPGTSRNGRYRSDFERFYLRRCRFRFSLRKCRRIYRNRGERTYGRFDDRFDGRHDRWRRNSNRDRIRRIRVRDRDRFEDRRDAWKRERKIKDRQLKQRDKRIDRLEDRLKSDAKRNRKRNRRIRRRLRRRFDDD